MVKLKRRKLCECGCGKEVSQGKRFVQWHGGRGRKLSEEHKRNIRLSSLSGELSPHWKGDKAKPQSKRLRTYRQTKALFKKPQACAKCGEVKTGRDQMRKQHIDEDKFNDDPANVLWLCISCHENLEKKIAEQTTKYRKGLLLKMSQIKKKRARKSTLTN